MVDFKVDSKRAYRGDMKSYESGMVQGGFSLSSSGTTTQKVKTKLKSYFNSFR